MANKKRVKQKMQCLRAPVFGNKTELLSLLALKNKVPAARYVCFCQLFFFREELTHSQNILQTVGNKVDTMQMSLPAYSYFHLSRKCFHQELSQNALTNSKKFELITLNYFDLNLNDNKTRLCSFINIFHAWKMLLS